MRPVRLAVAGAGVIGKRHIEEVAADPDVTLASIVDHGPVGSELAPKYGVPLYQSLAELFEQVVQLHLSAAAAARYFLRRTRRHRERGILTGGCPWLAAT